RFDARLYGLAREAALTPRDDLLARSWRPRRRAATVLTRADPSPAPARSLDPEHAGERPADDSGPRRQDLCRPKPVPDAWRWPFDPCPSRGFERAREGGVRGPYDWRAAVPACLEMFYISLMFFCAISKGPR